MGNLLTCDGEVYQPKPHVCKDCGKRLSWQTKGNKCLDCLKPELRKRIRWASKFRRSEKDPNVDWKKRMAYVRSFRGRT